MEKLQDVRKVKNFVTYTLSSDIIRYHGRKASVSSDIGSIPKCFLDNAARCL